MQGGGYYHKTVKHVLQHNSGQVIMLAVLLADPTTPRPREESKKRRRSLKTTLAPLAHEAFRSVCTIVVHTAPHLAASSALTLLCTAITRAHSRTTTVTHSRQRPLRGPAFNPTTKTSPTDP
ncbi:hypothetical protein BST61_g240 [Cercospora zeina]